MKTTRIIAAALLSAATAACATPAATPPAATPPAATASAAIGSAAYFSSLETAPAAPLAAEADYRAAFASLAGLADVKAASFASEGAGAVARNVTIAFGKDGKSGVKVAELRLYGVDAASFGAPLGEDGRKIAERIDMKGVASFGLEGLMSEVTTAYKTALESAFEKGGDNKSKAATKDALADIGEVKTYKISFSRLISDGLTIYGVDGGAPESADNPGGVLKIFAQWGRAISADGFLARDMATDYQYGAGGAQKMKMSAAYAAYRGLRRGDMDGMTLKRVALDMAAPKRDKAPAFTMSGGVDRYDVTDVRLAKLFSYWAAGASPPASDVNLLSLGVWRSEGGRYLLNGAPFFSAASAETDLTHFHWLMPTSIKIKANHLVYDFDAIMKLGAASASASAQKPETAENVEAMMASFARHGLSRLDISYTSDYSWAPATGATTFKSASTLEGLGDFNFDLGAALPNFRALAATQDKKTGAVDFAKFGAAFADAKLVRFSSSLKDAGLLDRTFALAADLQEKKAGVKPGAIDPKTLRSAASLAMRAGAKASPAPMLVDAFADFVEKGGVVDFAARPKKAVPFVEIAAKGPKGESPIERLGLSAAQHTE